MQEKIGEEQCNHGKKTLAISKQAVKRPTIFCWVERIYVGTKPKDDETISFIIFYPIRFAQS